MVTRWHRSGTIMAPLAQSVTGCADVRDEDRITAPGLYPEHDLFIQQTKLKNTLRHWMGEDLITHLGTEYYEE
jgi:hypothetical protein